MDDIFSLPVHPAADVFPMMADDELKELAADIKENGLREPVVIADVDMEISPGQKETITVIVDGRNRRAACQIAGTTPHTRKLNGKDNLVAFILSANIHRRHMTKGQRAMAVAMIYPEPESKGSRSGKTTNILATEMFAGSRLSSARMVLAIAPDLAPNVLAGTVSLDAAYETAKQRKRAAASDEEKIAYLRERHPDLAAQVTDGEKTLADAEAEAKQRDAQREERQRTAASLIEQWASASRTFATSTTDWLADDAVRADAIVRLGGKDALKEKSEEIKQGAQRLIEWLNQ